MNMAKKGFSSVLTLIFLTIGIIIAIGIVTFYFNYNISKFETLLDSSNSLKMESFTASEVSDISGEYLPLNRFDSIFALNYSNFLSTYLSFDVSDDFVFDFVSKDKIMGDFSFEQGLSGNSLSLDKPFGLENVFFNNTYTISFYLKAETLDSGSVVSNSFLDVYINSGNLVVDENCQVSSPIDLNEWNHVMISRKSGSIVLFVNDVPSEIICPSISSSLENVSFGESNAFMDDFFITNNAIDDSYAQLYYDQILFKDSVKRFSGDFNLKRVFLNSSYSNIAPFFYSLSPNIIPFKRGVEIDGMREFIFYKDDLLVSNSKYMDDVYFSEFDSDMFSADFDPYLFDSSYPNPLLLLDFEQPSFTGPDFYDKITGDLATSFMQASIREQNSVNNVLEFSGGYSVLPGVNLNLNDFTLMFKIKPIKNLNSGDLIDYSGSFRLGLDATGEKSDLIFYRTSGGLEESVILNDVLNYGVFNSVVIEYDSSLGVSIFVNGDLVGSDASLNGVLDFVSSDFIINDGVNLAGQLDNLVIIDGTDESLSSDFQSRNIFTDGSNLYFYSSSKEDSTSQSDFSTPLITLPILKGIDSIEGGLVFDPASSLETPIFDLTKPSSLDISISNFDKYKKTYFYMDFKDCSSYAQDESGKQFYLNYNYVSDSFLDGSCSLKGGLNSLSSSFHLDYSLFSLHFFLKATEGETISMSSLLGDINFNVSAENINIDFLETSLTGVIDSNWHLVSLIKNGNLIELYIDGNLVDSSTNPASGISRTSFNFNSGDYLISEILLENRDSSLKSSTFFSNRKLDLTSDFDYTKTHYCSENLLSFVSCNKNSEYRYHFFEFDFLSSGILSGFDIDSSLKKIKVINSGDRTYAPTDIDYYLDGNIFPREEISFFNTFFEKQNVLRPGDHLELLCSSEGSISTYYGYKKLLNCNG